MTDLKELFRYATEHEPPPVAGPAAVFERAGAIRRRQRTTSALAVVALAGALVAGFTVARPFDAAPPVPPATTAPSPAVRIGATRVMEALREDVLHWEVRLASEISRPGLARVVVVDGGGRTTLEVSVDPGYPGEHWYGCAGPTETPPAQCIETVLPDRTRVMSIDRPKPDGIHLRQVDTLTPDGLRVQVTEWNAEDVKRGPSTRAVPVFPMDDMRRFATAEVWRAVAAGN